MPTPEQLAALKKLVSEMNQDKRTAPPLTEGRVSKGGQNSPKDIGPRPQAPVGSGVFTPETQAQIDKTQQMGYQLGFYFDQFKTNAQANQFLTDVAEEAKRARQSHQPFHSAHEAYAVILEELDEFKEEVWKKSADRDTKNMITELVQIAAMCLCASQELGL